MSDLMMKSFECESDVFQGVTLIIGEAEVSTDQARPAEHKYILFRGTDAEGSMKYIVNVSDYPMMWLAHDDEGERIDEQSEMYGEYDEIEKTEVIERVKRLMDLYYEVM